MKIGIFQTLDFEDNQFFYVYRFNENICKQDVLNRKEAIMAHYQYRPQGVCSVLIDFDLDGDKVTNVNFKGGCNGNLKAISKLIDGASVDYIESKLKGNTCGFRSTSCADQLARAVRAAYEKENS